MNSPIVHQPSIANDLAEQLACVRKYRASAYRKPDPLAAAIGAAAANIMEVEAQLSGALRQAMQASPVLLENLPVYLPAIERILRLTKLSTQTTQLEIQLAKQNRDQRPGHP